LSILTTISVLRRKASMGHAKASISMLPAAPLGPSAW
jgi:hypothetical protein